MSSNRTDIMPDCRNECSHKWVATRDAEGGMIKAENNEWEVYTHCDHCETAKIETYSGGSVVRTEYA